MRGLGNTDTSLYWRIGRHVSCKYPSIFELEKIKKKSSAQISSASIGSSSTTAATPMNAVELISAARVISANNDEKKPLWRYRRKISGSYSRNCLLCLFQCSSLAEK